MPLLQERQLDRPVARDEETERARPLAAAEGQVVGDRRRGEHDPARPHEGVLERLEMHAHHLARDGRQEDLEPVVADRPHRVVEVDLVARQQHQMLDLVLSIQTMAWPFAAPPEVPAERAT